jgi:hypothetical protein
MRPAATFAWRWLALFWLVALGTHGSGLYQPMHCDYSSRLRVARDWAAGQALYRETYDNTQPVVYLWMLLTDSSHPAVSAFLAETLLAAMACVVFRSLLLRIAPRAAGVIPVLLIALSGASPTFYGGQITEAPALWWGILALSLFWLSLKTGRLFLAYFAGLCCFLMVAFRIPSAAFVVCLAPPIWQAIARRKKFWPTMWIALLGVASGMFALGIHGAVSGYWGDFLDTLGRNFQYGSLNRVPLATSLVAAAKTCVRIVLNPSLAGVLLIVGLGMLLAQRKLLRRGEKLLLATFGLWLLAALASAYPGSRHYAHYYHLVWPAVAVVGGLWLAPLRRRVKTTTRRSIPATTTVPRLAAGSPLSLWERARVRVFPSAINPSSLPRLSPNRRGSKTGTPTAVQLIDRLTFSLAAGVVLMVALAQAFAGVKALRDWRTGDHPANDVAKVEQFLTANTSPATPILVNVWGDSAELYWRVPRPAPSLAIPHVIPSDRYGAWAQATLDRLPQWIVTDGTPWEPIDGPLVDSRAIALRNELVAAIERDYNEVQRFGNVRILRRNGR